MVHTYEAVSMCVRKNQRRRSELNETPEQQKKLATMMEFFGNALGPQHELALYELKEDNTGAAVQVEFSLVTDMQEGDPLPEDLVTLLNRSQWGDISYQTGLTALLDEHRIANLGVLYLPNVIPGKRYLLTMLWDSSDYLDMVNRLLTISNLDSKLNLSGLNPRELNKDNLIRFPSAQRRMEEDKEDSLLDISLVQIDAEIQKVLGSRAKSQSAITQEVRLEIVSKLYRRGFFEIKGIVRRVAQRLYCSEATIYRYLSQLEKKTKPCDP